MAFRGIGVSGGLGSGGLVVGLDDLSNRNDSVILLINS